MHSADRTIRKRAAVGCGQQRLLTAVPQREGDYGRHIVCSIDPRKQQPAPRRPTRFASMPRCLTASEIERLLAVGRAFRSTVVVRACQVDEKSEWATPRGDVLHADKGDWWVLDGDDRWSVSGKVFDQTYENVGGNQFRKVATVTAVPLDEAFEIETLEGMASGEPGDWLVRNPSGECWPVPADVFAKRYEEA